MATRSDLKWADDDDSVSISPDGTRIVTEIVEKDGKKLKITKKMKVIKEVTKVNKNVLARRQWKKFGDCQGLPPGPEDNITYLSGETFTLDLRPKKREEVKDDGDGMSKLSATGTSIVVCRLCGEHGHWTRQCPKNTGAASSAMDLGLETKEAPKAGAAGAAAGGKYVPLHLREGASKSGGPPRDEGFSLKVSNLAEETTDADLQDLFRPFGHTLRIFMAKHQDSGLSRGFAFISYVHQEDAQAAIDKLNGHGYASLILRVEWAKPREKREEK